jgi:hypothetical protein
MERKRGYLVVIVAAAALMLLFVGLMYNAASLKKQNINLANQVAYASEKLAAKEDLMIYWVGDFPAELGGIAPVVTVISPDQISEDTMPVKSVEFKVTAYDADGNLVKDETPRDYKDNMLLVLYNVSFVSDEQKDIISNCIVDNNVPVLAIGRSSISITRDILMYTPGDFEENDSFYYLLGTGYKDHVLDNSAIAEGKDAFALNLCDYVYSLFYAYEPAEESSQTEAQTEVQTEELPSDSVQEEPSQLESEPEM